MKHFIYGIALGAIAGAVAYKKIQGDKIPQKVLGSAREKVNCD